MYMIPPHTPISMLARHMLRMLNINGCFFERWQHHKIHPNYEKGVRVSTMDISRICYMAVLF